MRLLHHLLESAADAWPDRESVRDRGRSLTYGELDARANRLAHLLVSLGVRLGDRVGIYRTKSAESLVAIYAAMKTGAAYVPLDPGAPPARLGSIAGNCGLRVLVTAPDQAAAWGELAGAGVRDLVVLDEGDLPPAPAGARLHGPAAVEAQPATRPGVRAIAADLAYVLYTSGSTGEPKGVMLSHQNALAFVDWAARHLGLGPDDVLSSHAPLHFDLSVFDLFAAAAASAAVVLVPPEASVFPGRIARFIADEAITTWYSVPSILSMLTLRGGLRGGEFPHLRTIVFAGEVFPTKYLRRLMELLPHVRFTNWYGPTETNVCTYYDVPVLDPANDDPIPIGRAIAGAECFVVTADGRIAERGEVGELHVRGGTVMQGYWGDPERTARALVPNPFSRGPRDPVYRTGDLVREDANGDYRFLGRRDAQIKSRGYRIELGDIEAALSAHPDVVECAATAVPDELVTNRIKAYVVVRNGLGGADLARFCGERIPKYMIPEAFELRGALPKTSTGKIDRQALRAEASQKEQERS